MLRTHRARVVAESLPHGGSAVVVSRELVSAMGGEMLKQRIHPPGPAGKHVPEAVPGFVVSAEERARPADQQLSGPASSVLTTVPWSGTAAERAAASEQNGGERRGKAGKRTEAGLVGAR
jgi:hypothetical protein